MKISPGCLVELEYDIFDEGDELVESSAGDDPIEFVHGEGAVLPGLEEALLGREAGEELRVPLAAEQAFGDYNPEGLVSLPRQELSAEAELVPGSWITVLVHEGETPPERSEDALGEIEMRVVEVSDEQVILDANHPLAGQSVTFRVRVVSVRAAPA